MTISCRLISETVAKSYGVTVRDLNSRRRSGDIILPRHMSWTLAKNLTGRSFPEIGRFMGGRDHTTVMHGVRKIEEAIDRDRQIAANYAQLVEAIVILGEASNKADRIAIRFHDIEPIEIAEAFLEAKLRDFIPSLEAIRGLCMGVLHYAAEVEQLTAVLEQKDAMLEQKDAELGRLVVAACKQADLWHAERSALEGRIESLTLRNEKNEAVLHAAMTVVAKTKALRIAETTINERPARRALETSLHALQTTFERT